MMCFFYTKNYGIFLSGVLQDIAHKSNNSAKILKKKEIKKKEQHSNQRIYVVFHNHGREPRLSGQCSHGVW